MVSDKSTRVEQKPRPQGRDAVTSALTQAALELLAEQGISFSVRDVAARANVNHGLIHRHFGSKQALLAAALAERNADLGKELVNEVSPLDASLRGDPPTATLLARLILDDATELIGEHVAANAVVNRAAAQEAGPNGLTAAERAAVANAISLGWAVFGGYSLRAVGALPRPEITATLRTLTNELLGHQSPV